MVKWLGVMVLLTLLAGGGGVLSGLTLVSTLKPAAAAKVVETAAAPGPAVSGGIKDLPPIVTNLAGSGKTWVRLEASILFDPKALPQPDHVASEITGDLLDYLRTVPLSGLDGPSGLQHLRQDLDERADIRSEGKVKRLLIRTLVIQ